MSGTAARSAPRVRTFHSGADSPTGPGRSGRHAMRKPRTWLPESPRKADARGKFHGRNPTTAPHTSHASGPEVKPPRTAALITPRPAHRPFMLSLMLNAFVM